MKNILLVEPLKEKTWGKNNQYLGLLRIATLQKNRGNKVEYVIAPDVPSFYPDEIFVTSLFTYWYDKVWETIKIYKTMFPKAKILLGGIYATISPEHAKGSGADEVIIGEYENARNYFPDTSILPYKQDFTYLFTSYGCNRACTYCATHLLYGKGIIQENPDKVLEQIKKIKENGIKNIWVGDDNLLANAEQHICVICNKIIQEGIKVNLYLPGGMAAKDFTQKIAYFMKEAGFKEISFAIESVSQEVRDKMGRKDNTTEQDLQRALIYADKAGFSRINTNVYYIIGLSYQKITDMVKTTLFLLNEGVWAHPQRFTPIPNTVEWKRLKLERWDYKDLHYKKFLSPNQDNFTSEDLNMIYKIARFYNIGNRYTNYNPYRAKDKASLTFRELGFNHIGIEKDRRYCEIVR
ncbi:hypothetical protein ES705_26280 [subsurface metagenome]